MKSLILVIIGIILGVSTLALAQSVTFTESTYPAELHVYRNGCDAGAPGPGVYCRVLAVIDVTSPSGSSMRWREKGRVPKQMILDLVNAMEILDDTGRMADFPQTRTVVDAGPQ